ncbi:MAG: hypothetical protein LBS29_02470 [Endomicrobium sp.]|jgi:hypothetical protein|uniref:hypothetical protein n=1 Tax=Candidatus Endomicrobiellum cubanum TaxID=3242325 RepID=UPI0028357A37|nr:hypothetical protein [Endomicrobium sp.]MDR2395245.1 hypothetical protein [Endomicrobium sp.]
MKKLGIPAVILISFLLIFIQTAGSFYCKSFSGFSYAALIIIDAFLLLTILVNKNEFAGLKKAQLVSIILNIIVLIILSFTLIFKSLVVIKTTSAVNTNVIILITLFTSIILLICSFSNKKFIYTSILSIPIIAGFSLFENYHLTDCVLSIFFCIIIFIRSIILIKNSILDRQ